MTLFTDKEIREHYAQKDEYDEGWLDAAEIADRRYVAFLESLRLGLLALDETEAVKFLDHTTQSPHDEVHAGEIPEHADHRQQEQNTSDTFVNQEFISTAPADTQSHSPHHKPLPLHGEECHGVEAQHSECSADTHHGLKIIDVKIVGLCSQHRKEGDEIPRYKDGSIIPDSEIACLMDSFDSDAHRPTPESRLPKGRTGEGREKGNSTDIHARQQTKPKDGLQNESSRESLIRRDKTAGESSSDVCECGDDKSQHQTYSGTCEECGCPEFKPRGAA